MYSYIIGEPVAVDADRLILENNGIGYEIFASMETLSRVQVGEISKIYTRLIVREDSMSLFGFFSEKEREVYDLLNRVNSIGPKTALAILSTLSAEEIIHAIHNNDQKALSRAPGIGKKTAGRIVLELLDYVKNMPELEGVSGKLPGVSVENTTSIKLAREALTALGYRGEEADRALMHIDSSLGTEEIIRLALKAMS